VITGAALTAGSVLGVASPALANNFVVNNAGDAGDSVCQDATPGDCTFADAIYSSNANTADNDTITFASNITGVSVTAGQIPVTDGVYIYGNGPKDTVIDANGTSRILYLNPTDSGDPVTIGGVTLTGGDAGANGGGAIFDFDANLNVYSSVLRGNQAFRGGAIFEYGGYYGGEDLDISQTTISGNTADDDGGGIYSRGTIGQLKVSTVSGNHAGESSGNVGGGIYMYLGVGSYIDDSTITRNSAFSGGGVYLYYRNTAFSYNSMFAGNSASPGFGRDFSGYVNAESSLFQDTTFTYIGPIAGFPTPNITGQDPQLGPLQDNGGYTPTHLLAPTSPALDKGYSYYGFDQRNIDRPVDITTIANTPGADGSDIGAVESTAAEATIPGGPQPPATTPPTKKKKCKKKKKKHHSAQSAKKKKCKKKKHKRSAAADRPQGGRDLGDLAFRVKQHAKVTGQSSGAGPAPRGTRR
jgi:predicted outer membrane repeat protein